MENNNSDKVQIQSNLSAVIKSFSENQVLSERKISFPSVVRSQTESVRKLAIDNYEMLFHFVCLVLEKYFDYCYPALKNATQQIAADLIDTRPSWKADDFINLCKYFRQNPSETYGQLTPEKFMLRIADYEDQRSMAMEQSKNEQRGKIIEENKTLNPLAEKLALKMREKGNVPTGDEKLGKLMDAQREKSERIGYGRLATKPQNHQEFFEPKNV